MISEYKFFHGAVLTELIDIAEKELSFGELHEEGRLTSYTIDNRLGLHIKHSTARLPPWHFTITRSNLAEFLELRRSFEDVFIVFVCNTVGMAALSIEELVSIIDASSSEQSWVRIDRRRSGRFGVVGNGGRLPRKKGSGVSVILEALGQLAVPAS